MAVLKEGSRGTEVAKLQLLLNSASKPGPRLKADGKFGPRTAAAVAAFQKASRLKPDRIVGPKTWNALGQKPASKLPPPKAGANTKWMKVAVAELGVHENARQGRHTKRIVEYHATTTLGAKKDETPWCSSFVNWVVIQAGYKGTNNALAMSWLKWGHKLKQPRKGAVTVIQRKGKKSDKATGSRTGYHVGFLVSVTPKRIRLLGGNQGNQVKYSSFSRASYDIRGYRWPTI